MSRISNSLDVNSLTVDYDRCRWFRRRYCCRWMSHSSSAIYHFVQVTPPWAESWNLRWSLSNQATSLCRIVNSSYHWERIWRIGKMMVKGNWIQRFSTSHALLFSSWDDQCGLSFRKLRWIGRHRSGEHDRFSRSTIRKWKTSITIPVP